MVGFWNSWLSNNFVRREVGNITRHPHLLLLKLSSGHNPDHITDKPYTQIH